MNPHSETGPDSLSTFPPPSTNPLAPPIAPGAMPPPRTVWPTVLGVIAIVFGALGALQGVFGLLAPLLFSGFRGAAGNMQGFDPFAGMDQYKWHLAASSILTMVAGGLLLFGAILLSTRKRSSRGVLLAWSIFKMFVVVFGAWIGWMVNQVQFAAMQQSGAMSPAMGGAGGMMDVMSGIGAVIGIAWGWALPIFMIIWFMRSRIRSEVATWS